MMFMLEVMRGREGGGCASRDWIGVAGVEF